MTFAAFWITFKSINMMKVELGGGVTVGALFKNKNFVTIILSLGATYGVYILASLIVSPPPETPIPWLASGADDRRLVLPYRSTTTPGTWVSLAHPLFPVPNLPTCRLIISLSSLRPVPQ
jgi:hypothetical protein